MAFVRTVLGDVPAAALGVCYAHEHIIIDRSLATEEDPTFLIDDVEKAVEELREIYNLGVRAMIDTMPGRAGRNAAKLARVSAASGVQIVCPTGMHLAKYYRPDDPLMSLDVRGLADCFIEEITQGVRDDVPAPKPQAGVIKIASSLDALTPHEHKVFAAAAMAHHATGCPIITHTEQGTAAAEQVDVLERAGVNLAKVTLSHTDRRPDVAMHRSLLKRGVNLEYDSCFRWKAGQGNPSLDLIRELVNDFPCQLMLGMDAARRGYWRSYGGSPGLRFLVSDFWSQTEAAGVEASLIERMFRQNPANAFSLDSATATA